MLMQKIGEFPLFERQKIHMQLQFFDCVFDELPCLEDIHKYRLLPADCLSFPLMKLAMNRSVFLVSNRQFPKKHLIFLGNTPGPSNKEMCFKQSILWPTIEYELGIFYFTWRDKKYDMTEDGIYDYEGRRNFVARHAT